MANDSQHKENGEHRSEPREILKEFHSVQFAIGKVGPVYMFKLRDLSSQGMCILVRQDSAVLKMLKVGDEMEMEFFRPETRLPTEQLRTKVRHISSPEGANQVKGHCRVGFSIVRRQPGEA
jgi:hypothetical protein